MPTAPLGLSHAYMQGKIEQAKRIKPNKGKSHKQLPKQNLFLLLPSLLHPPSKHQTVRALLETSLHVGKRLPQQRNLNLSDTGELRSQRQMSERGDKKKEQRIELC